MKNLTTSTIAIIIGIILLAIGFIQPARYEKAKENGYEVEATISDVKISEESDMESGFTSTVYTVYADYEVDGKEYKNVKVGKYYDTDEYYVGKAIKVTVNPDSPGRPLAEVGVLATVGLVILVIGIIGKIKNKKQKTKEGSPS